MRLLLSLAARHRNDGQRTKMISQTNVESDTHLSRQRNGLLTSDCEEVGSDLSSVRYMDRDCFRTTHDPRVIARFTSLSRFKLTSSAETVDYVNQGLTPWDDLANAP